MRQFVLAMSLVLSTPLVAEAVTPPQVDGPKAPMAFTAKPPVGSKARCPVTGEEFTVRASTASSTYKGRVYVFCCPECKPTFDKDPAKYAK